MILLDTAAPILWMTGLSQTTSAHASLLNNFEIAATAIIAFCFFHEKISKRVWCGIFFITAACLMLSFEGFEALSFSFHSLFIILAAILWGLENNCTRMLSDTDPLSVVVYKGLGSGGSALLIAFFCSEPLPPFSTIAGISLLGFFSYGLSIYFYIYAQRFLGAAKTSAYYSIAPFFGVILSFLLFSTLPDFCFWSALAAMAVGTYLVSTDRPSP